MFTTTTVRTFSDLPCAFELFNLFVTLENAGRFLYDQGIFSSTMYCSKCNNSMRLNGQSFRCGRRTCRFRVTARDGTFFSRMRVPLDKVLQYLYYFISGASTTQIINYTQISKPTVATLNKYTRQLLADAVDLSDVTIGGPGIIVEIDESKFGKVKYHRGHRVEGTWVLGGVGRTEERKIFAVVAESRDAETLERIIQLHVLPGSIIHTDCLKGYANLGRLGYTHRIVNHTQNFRDSETGVHTNTIEGTWLGIKLGIPLRCRNRKVIDDFL